jgi:phosphoenolpyruvate carboxykinase (GTP)
MATAPHAIVALPALSRAVTEWVQAVRALTQPAAVHWCDGSAAELRELTSELVRGGALQPLNAQAFPDCHLAPRA